MNRVTIIALGSVGIMSLVAALIVPAQEHGPSAKAHAVATPSQGEDAAFAEVLTIKRDRTGQFHLNASVNGSEVNFLVDTGADILALSEEEAQNLGLSISPDQFAPIMQTASGVAEGAKVLLNNVEVAGVQLRDVDAVVVKGLSTNLLGQSVLRQLGGVSLQGDRMIINGR